MNQTYKKNFLHAGSLAQQVRAYGKSLIKTKASYFEVISKINQKIVGLGAIPAFPPQIALNHVAAHFLPQPNADIIFSDEVVKLDIGVAYRGAIGDCAVTIDLSGKYQSLIDATEAALLKAEQSIKVGLPIREIGKIIEETIDSYGYTSIKNLSGHGLGVNQIHRPPVIPNYEDQSTGLVKPGMTFAIEPFATNGKGFIHEEGAPTIFSYVATRPILFTINPRLLARIKAYQGLPFAIHDLISAELPLVEVEKGLQELLNKKIIIGYPPLIENAQGMVAQAENSVLVDGEGKVFISTR